MSSSEPENPTRSGRTVVVTGASAGLGRAIALEFARQGDGVTLLARDPGRLKEAADDVERASGATLALPTDVADWHTVEEAAARVGREYGPVDVWVNNAMTSIFAPFLDTAPEDFERATAVTYLGFVNGTRAALHRMTARDRGVLVQVGSALAYRGIPLQSAYCGSKHAMVGFTESVITELLHDHSKVRVAMVHMPALNTPQFDWVRSYLGRQPQPVAPVCEPELGARAVRYAAERPRRRAYYVGTFHIAHGDGEQVRAWPPRPRPRPDGLRLPAEQRSGRAWNVRTTSTSPCRGTSPPTGASTIAPMGARPGRRSGATPVHRRLTPQARSEYT